MAERGSYDVDEHLLSPAEVAAKYGVDVNVDNPGQSKGLSSAQVKELQARHGKNQLTPPAETPEWLKFLRQFTNPLMMLLVIAGGLTYMAYALQPVKDANNLILASALIIVVSATCVMSYWQERSASNVMASLSKMMPAKCTVVRNGVEQKVDAAELVPGDFVRLYIGDRIPADIRIIETYDLKVECSSLTGESELVPASVNKKHDMAAEARNLVFMSSLAMNGEGRGIVVRTGDNTMIGKIANLASGTAGHQTSLQVEVHRLVKFVAILAFCTGLVLFAIGLIRKMAPIDAFVNGFILVIVANVPEGLPATVTSCLALTAMRLKEKQVLIKRTDIIENLGCATIIASDKTGTLTQNKMTVENIWCNCELHNGATFLPPPPPPAMPLARSSLARMSAALKQSIGRISRHSMLLSRTSLAKASIAGSASMMVGRKAVLSGDGRLGYVDVDKPVSTTSRPGSLSAGSETAVESKAPTQPEPPATPFTMQAVRDPSQANWANASALTRLVTLATVCNKAKFSVDKAAAEKPEGATVIDVPTFQPNADTRVVLGDATDSGLLRYVDRMSNGVERTRFAYRQLFEIPFNSANKWAMTVTECPGAPDKHIVMLKGAPEIVLTKCSHYYQNKEERAIDEPFKDQMMGAYERCGFMGERVIGLSYKVVDAKDPNSYKTEDGAPSASGLVFLGLISLVDPPRPGVLEAVHKARAAGIRVAMVTGDHPLTAEAIARKVGIVTLQTRREVAAELGVDPETIPIEDERVGAIVIPGSKLREIKTEEEWDAILDKPEIVFARTSPQQKLQIVENLQRLGEVVAVTGDGVNDSPALKKAQIGVAMGKGGSDVARDAADIVLLDDEFPSIINAIEEGRVIYDNLKKTIAYSLTHAMPEVFPLFLNLVLRFPIGLGGLLILSIDLITEQGPAISLAYEGPESNVMERPPRDLETDRLISASLLRYSYLIAGIFQAILCMLAFFSIFWWNGVSIDYVFDRGVENWNPQAADLTIGTCVAVSGGNTLCRVLNKDEQINIYYQAQSAWYITLIMCQFWHIWVCKTRQVSIFKHGLFSNLATVWGVSISIPVMVLIVYAPFLQGIFSTANMVGIGWVPQLGFLLFFVPYTEYSKYLTRKDPDGWWATHMQW